MAAASVDEYLESLPPERRTALTAVRDVIRANLPAGYEEGMEFGMPAYYVPLERYPDTYNGQPLMIAALASQKQYMSVYLMGVYGDPALERWFSDEYARAGKRLDMGKSCVRFRTLDDLPLALIGDVIAKVGVDDYLAKYEASRAAASKPAKTSTNKSRATAKKPPKRSAATAKRSPNRSAATAKKSANKSRATAKKSPKRSAATAKKSGRRASA